MTAEVPHPEGVIRIHPEHPHGAVQDWYIILDTDEREVYLEELPAIMKIKDIPSLIAALAKALEWAVE